MIEVQRYINDKRNEWNRFISSSTNSTFLSRPPFSKHCYTAGPQVLNVLSGTPSSILSATDCDDNICQEGEDKWVYYECGISEVRF